MATPNIISPPEALDLCTRKRSHSPDRYAHELPIRSPIYDTSTGQYSPVSNSNSDSESCEVTNSSEVINLNSKSKTCRPFKAYIKDPLTLAQGLVSTEMLLHKDSTEAFAEFRNKVMSQVQAANNGTNKNMRRSTYQINERSEDPTYWEKRRKNNEAAKRSRDARRAKEDEIAIRCAFLERENGHLKFVAETLRKELEKLQEIIYLRNY